MAILKRRLPRKTRGFDGERSKSEDQPKRSATGHQTLVNVHGSGNGSKNSCHQHCCCEKCSPKPEKKSVNVLGTGLAVIGIISLAFVLALTGFLKGVEVGVEKEAARNARYPLDTQVPRAIPTEEGGPCQGFEDGLCPDAWDARFYMARSRYFLNRGDAEVAMGELDKARVFYDWTIALGRPVGAHVARHAATRLQFLNLTCDYDDGSLARVARDKEFNVLGGEIGMDQRQRALTALAHYTGKVDGEHNQETRDAIRRFQSSLWFPETGVLSAEQAVLLVCGAAEVGNDPASQNLLGTMYATGLGVRQNTDKALQWFNEAARQDSPDAFWNLALLFGTQTTESSVLVCDADMSPDRADSFLREAYDAGHPAAVAAVDAYGDDDPETRWSKISGDLRTPEALTRVGKGCNPNG